MRPPAPPPPACSIINVPYIKATPQVPRANTGYSGFADRGTKLFQEEHDTRDDSIFRSQERPFFPYMTPVIVTKTEEDINIKSHYPSIRENPAERKTVRN